MQKDKKTRSRRATVKKKPEENPVKLSEQDQKHFNDEMKDADEETKTQWLNRRSKEQVEIKKNNFVVDTWYVKVGNKLVRKQKKKSGGAYSHYMGNYIKHPALLTDEVKENLRGE